MISQQDAFICGKLSALEFVVEVMFANQLAQMPKAAADAFVDDLVSREG